MTPASPFRPGGQYFAPLLGAVAVALVAGVASFYLFDTPDPLAEAEPVVEAAPAAAVTASPDPPDTPIVLPALGDSDALVRDLVSGLTSHPAFAAWLIPDDLVRLFVLVVENLADGSNPADRIRPLQPTQRFQATGEPSQPTLDPVSYARYNTHAEIVASIDPVGAAALYRTLYPLITVAYAELGHPDGGFDDTLRRALGRLLATPVLEREVALTPRATFFEFADPELEQLSPVQKQFMGMGPRNVRAVQASVRDIARELGIAASSLPTPVVIR